MLRRMTHKEFIDYARERGMAVERVTRTSVYVEEPVSIIPRQFLSRPDVRKVMESYTPSERMLDCLRAEDKIAAIRVLRNETGLGLYESVNFINVNRGVWIHGTR